MNDCYLTKEEATELLELHFNDFKDVFINSWQDWLNSPIAAQMQHKNLRAVSIWNQLLYHCQRKFENHPEIKYIKLRTQQHGILVGNNIFIRFKKGDKSLISTNYPTQTALAFNDPSQDLFGGVSRLELVYVLNSLETNIERIALVQRENKSIVWALDILNANESVDENINTFVMPSSSAQAKQTAAKSVVKSKKKLTGNQNDESKHGS